MGGKVKVGAGWRQFYLGGRKKINFLSSFLRLQVFHAKPWDYALDKQGICFIRR
jgi:hypothetical protein